MSMKIFSLLCAAALFSVVSGKAEWTYTKDAKDGPTNWKDLEGYAECGENSQSPIDINTSAAVEDLDLGKFTKSALTEPTSMSFKNNGHSIKVSLTGGYKLPENIAALPGAFQAAQFHFHWGTPAGSEHELDGQQFFGEMHIVHFNTKYDSLTESVHKKDGLAVLGFFVETSEDAEENVAFNKFLDSSTKIPNSNDSFDISTFAIHELLPENIDNFYRYNGSLTTPPCAETVTWTMFDSKISISSKQAEIFRSWSNLTNNFRPVQKLNKRVVKKNFKSVKGGAAESVNGNVSLLVIAVTLAVNLLHF